MPKSAPARRATLRASAIVIACLTLVGLAIYFAKGHVSGWAAGKAMPTDLQGNFGFNDCQYGRQVADEEECERVAINLAVAWRGTEFAADWPRGCYYIDAKGGPPRIWFNTHPDGAERHGAGPVCLDPIWPNAPSHRNVRLLEAGIGEIDCANGRLATSPPGCEFVASWLQVDFRGEEDAPDWPPGCYYIHAAGGGPRIWFNRAQHGSGNIHAAPLCKPKNAGATGWEDAPEDNRYEPFQQLIGRASCPAVPLESPEACAAAAERLKVLWRGEEHAAAWPRGCYYIHDTVRRRRVWWNNHDSGAAHPSAAPLCYRSRELQPLSAAASTTWDAVGLLLSEDMTPTCTATLVGDKAVLTSEYCAKKSSFFASGLEVVRDADELTQLAIATGDGGGTAEFPQAFPFDGEREDGGFRHACPAGLCPGRRAACVGRPAHRS